MTIAEQARKGVRPPATPRTVDLVEAGRQLGIGRSKTYEMAQNGEFPVRILKMGHRYRVPQSALDELLGTTQSAGADA